MSVTYRIKYEHRDAGESRTEEVLLRSDREPTQDEVYDAVRKDAERFNNPEAGATGFASFTVIYIEPLP